mmetsp:Transcript_17193/g.21007  ORF Transcript_17193/g.21007 Transcript_17193/m.21007 type:complete len:160 (+) Transcript_17193:271-750(+)
MDQSQQQQDEPRNAISISVRFSFPSSPTSTSTSTPSGKETEEQNNTDSNGNENKMTIMEETFDESNCDAALLGLPSGTEAVKPISGDYSYSGMHDHGPLPKPNENGDFAQLIGMVNQAKKHSDTLLTQIIENEKKTHSSKNTNNNNNGMDQRQKRLKVN